MKRILIVEDDNAMNQMLAENLALNEFECVQAYSGTEGLMCIKHEQFDLILLDLMLPGKSGEEVLNELREYTSAPVIIISAKDELDNKVTLLMQGAEDYITKPFQIKELLARIHVQLRKSGGGSVGNIIKYKELVLDKASMTATLCGERLVITHREFNIMELIFSTPYKVFSKNEIFKYAWEDYYEGEDKTINVHISNIRLKIKAVTDEPYIDTVWGIGFKAAD